MTIRISKIMDIKNILDIYDKCKVNLNEQGIFQWTVNYPNIEIITTDIKKGFLYLMENGNKIIGAINISEEQEDEYLKIDWEFNTGNILVIHRLVIDPEHQRKGYARKLMDFAENYAEINDYSSIRLDVYSQNERAIRFYKKRNYSIRGKVNFPERKYSFYCMEKEIKHTHQ
jgi:ribosomal protein S18 acetylase RimI-like enzyme